MSTRGTTTATRHSWPTNGRKGKIVSTKQFDKYPEQPDEPDRTAATQVQPTKDNGSTAEPPPEPPAAPPSENEDNYVAWCRYTQQRIVLCDSDSPNAFKVYRNPFRLPGAAAPTETKG